MSIISALMVRGSFRLGVLYGNEELATAAAETEREEREEEDRVRRRLYIMRQRINHMVFNDDEEFVQRFRLSKRTAANVVDLIEADIRSDTDQNSALSPTLQVLIAD